jgi:glycosyltransferase involved in cell wall biosynthesis
MRILFIAHYFQPEPNFFMGLPFAKKLVELGHQVEVLTGFPNYPGGRIYEGYRIKPLQREELEGIPLIRVPLYPSHDRSSFKRTVSYLSLAFSESLIGPFIVKKADVAYVAQGPATIGLPAVVMQLLRRIPFVYDIKDLWPDAVAATDMFDSKVGFKLIDKWSRFVYRCAKKIIVITPGVKQLLIERGVTEDKVELIYEWCDDAQIYQREANTGSGQQLGFEDRFNIVFAGNMGKPQALSAVLEAAKIVSNCPKIQFVFIGSGVEVDLLKNKAKSLGLTNVIFFPRRPISEIGSILRLADVLLVHLRDEPVFHIAIPSKTQAYMAAGRPILMAMRGDASDLVRKAQAGVSCEPENAQSIAEAVQKLYKMPRAELEEMGNKGRKFYQKELCFDIGVKKYERIFEEVVKSKRNKSNC